MKNNNQNLNSFNVYSCSEDEPTVAITLSEDVSLSSAISAVEKFLIAIGYVFPSGAHLGFEYNDLDSDDTETPQTDSIVSAIDMDAAYQELCRKLEVDNQRLNRHLNRAIEIADTLEQLLDNSVYGGARVKNLPIFRELSRLKEEIQN